jgi:hypothetical protein
MEQFLKILQQLNAANGMAMSLLSPGGAITLLIEGIRAIRASRKATNEDTTDLDQLLDKFDAEIEKLKASNAAYFAIPEKPVVSDPDA